jgi:ThiF family
MVDPITPSTGASISAAGTDVGNIIREATIAVDSMWADVATMEAPVAPQTANSALNEALKKSQEKKTKPQFDRMKGAKWFDAAQSRTLMVIGQGGIGSWLTLLLSRLGSIIYTFDADRYEAHNMTGQLVRTTDIGKSKTAAVIEICRMFNDGVGIYANGEFRSDSFASNIMMCGLDNMAARTLAFSKWKAYMEDLRKNTDDEALIGSCFFQDGRLTAEQFQIFNIPGNRPDLIEKYEKEALFEEKEGYEGDCTFKQTSHTAAMVASHMVGFYTNWLTNLVTDDPKYSKLPFKYEYVIPFNLTMQDYVNT